MYISNMYTYCIPLLDEAQHMANKGSLAPFLAPPQLKKLFYPFWCVVIHWYNIIFIFINDYVKKIRQNQWYIPFNNLKIFNIQFNMTSIFCTKFSLTNPLWIAAKMKKTAAPLFLPPRPLSKTESLMNYLPIQSL